MLRVVITIVLVFCMTVIARSPRAGDPLPFRLTQRNKTIDYEKRPKTLFWGASSNGLQMTVWVSPLTPVVFGLIRNASDRRIHYCDYLLGLDVELYARKSNTSEWVKIPRIPIENPTIIGGLSCSSNDTLYPGEEMKTSPTAYRRNRIIGHHTFEVDLAEYKFSDDWQGVFDCKIAQHIFGGKHPDRYQGDVESPSFTVKLPIAGK